MKRDPEKHAAWQKRSAEKARAKRSAPKQPKVPKPRSPKEPPSSSPKPRKRLPPVNTARAAKRRLRDFGTPEQTAMINAMPCICAGRHPACTGGPSEPSHIVSRAAGGDIDDQVPKSSGCHGAWHAHGRMTYLSTIGWTMEQLRAAADRTFAAITGAGMEDGSPS